MLSNKAFKIDHEESVRHVLDVIRNTNGTVSRSARLSFLYGAKVALVQGGLPVDCIREIQYEIDYYERNIDLEARNVRGKFDGAEEKEDCGSGL